MVLLISIKILQSGVSHNLPFFKICTHALLSCRFLGPPSLPQLHLQNVSMFAMPPRDLVITLGHKLVKLN